MPRIASEDYSRTVLLNDSIPNILRKAQPIRKGIDIKLYSLNGNSKEHSTITTFLTNRINPSPRDRKDKDDVDRLLAEALDKILVSDKVKSAKDYNKTNAPVSQKRMIIETEISKLENTGLDNYIKHIQVSDKKKGFGRLEY